ncbi:MAG TPA: TadE/TadG family type IV pilus assembly protein [Pyrinomonadaceae bacterium]|nr:TadE/TadG family type IV pilus assembly protein [Pyrinomonadaceae bacterium]
MRKLLDTFRRCGIVKDDSGGTLAEMALTLPLLIVLLAGVSEIGRYFQAYTTMAKSTRAAARYLSNHQYNSLEVARAKNLAVCGRLTACTADERLVKGASTDNVCIQTTKVDGTEQIEFVTVSIPRDPTMTCDADAVAVKLGYQPIFDLGGLLGDPAFSLTYPIAPSTTMRYIP